MTISKDLIKRAQKTREDGVITLKLDKGDSLAMHVSFAQDVFPGVSTEDIGVWRADGELVRLGARRRSTSSELKGRPSQSALTTGSCSLD